jgi:hypothetical protein
MNTLLTCLAQSGKEGSGWIGGEWGGLVWEWTVVVIYEWWREQGVTAGKVRQCARGNARPVPESRRAGAFGGFFREGAMAGKAVQCA